MIKISALILAMTLFHPGFAQATVGSAPPGQPMQGGDGATNTPEKAKAAKKAMKGKKADPGSTALAPVPAGPTSMEGGDKAAMTPEKAKTAKKHMKTNPDGNAVAAPPPSPPSNIQGGEKATNTPEKVKTARKAKKKMMQPAEPAQP